MTVKELIEELSKYPQELDVVGTARDDGPAEIFHQYAYLEDGERWADEDSLIVDGVKKVIVLYSSY